MPKMTFNPKWLQPQQEQQPTNKQVAAARGDKQIKHYLGKVRLK
jgi:hypothetical protein